MYVVENISVGGGVVVKPQSRFLKMTKNTPCGFLEIKRRTLVNQACVNAFCMLLVLLSRFGAILILL